MSQSRFAPLVRGALRLTIGALAFAMSFGNPARTTGAPAPAPVNPVQNCGGDSGGGGDGGDQCAYTNACTYFCPCGDSGGGGGDCYYGFQYGSYWCGGGEF